MFGRSGGVAAALSAFTGLHDAFHYMMLRDVEKNQLVAAAEIVGFSVRTMWRVETQVREKI